MCGRLSLSLEAVNEELVFPVASELSKLEVVKEVQLNVRG